jgi:phage terminase large subunit
MRINLQLKKRLFNQAYYPYLFDYSNRYEVYYGGAGSGKSHFVFQKIIIKALTQKRKVLVIRKVARTIKDSVFQMALDTLDKFMLLPQCEVNRSTYTIILPNGSQFLFKGIDDGGEKIKSITSLTDIVIEEATEITFDEFTQLDLRLRAKAANLQIYLMFNPVSKVNWCYKHFFKNGTPPNTFILKTTYKDNSFLPVEYINALEQMAKTNTTYYRIYALGEFCSLDKLVFSNWEVSSTPLPKDRRLSLLCGLDFGYVNDPSAFVVSYLDEEEKIIYVVDEYYEHAMLNDAIAQMIIYKGYGKEVIIADSAEQKSIEEIKRAGVVRIKAAAKGKGSILQGIQKLQQYKLLINPKCQNLITELQNYSWKKDKQSNEYINEPQDSFNHCIDALRYSLQCVDSYRKIKTLNKAALGL